MNLVSAKCPNCGANIQVDSERNECFCSFCGSKINTQQAISLVVKVDKSADYKNYLRLASENAEMGQFDEAVSYVDKALEIHPDSSRAWMLKAFFTSQCKEVDNDSNGAIEPGCVFYNEDYKKVLISGQKAIKYAGNTSEGTNYASLVYRLFLGITKATLVLIDNNASDQRWLRARYEELEEICYPGQIAHWGQHQHEEILAEEDRENFENLTNALDNATQFFTAVPRDFITPSYYPDIKELATLYVSAFKAINARVGVYNLNLSDEYLKHSKEMVALIKSYLPEEEASNENSVELSNEKQTESKVPMIILSFVVIFLLTIFALALMI